MYKLRIVWFVQGDRHLLYLCTMSGGRENWFNKWFNSSYYHILYQHRDQQEAARFIDNLLDYLQPTPGATMLDLACGRGRHSQYLCQKGYQVTGVDLSATNIAVAQQIGCPNLDFAVHDMRETYRAAYFDYVFNFFTSFGYFEAEADNVKTMQAIAESLKPGGTVVIDFMHTQQVIEHLVTNETKTLDGITFEIQKHYRPPFIEKEIRFTADGEAHFYMESVQALRLADFQRYCAAAGLTITALFGNYHLVPFHTATAERLIVVATKPAAV